MVTPQEQLLLQIETARARLAWARAQVESRVTTPALAKYITDFTEELRALVAGLEMEQDDENGEAGAQRVDTRLGEE